MKRNSQGGAAGPCARRADLSAYLLNELPAGRRGEFEEHLARCAVCARERDSLGRVIDRVKGVPAEPCRRDLTADILARLPSDAWSPARPRDRKVVLFPVLAKAAAILLAVAGLGALVFVGLPRGGSRAAASARPPLIALRGALDWLQKAQEQDGGWDAARWGAQKNYSVGVSALALMAFMGRDPDALRGPHGETVRRGIEYLVSRQDEQGLIGPRFTSATYNHGLATLAVLNACALESNATWKAAADRAVRFICSVQTESGGWGYLRSGRLPPNTSASIWPLRALLRAEALGYRDIRPHIEQAFAWLRSTVNQDGLVGYVRPDEFPYGPDTLTAAGAVCFLLDGGRSGQSAVEVMLSAVRRAAVEPSPAADFYRTYFVAEALGLAGEGSFPGTLASVGERLAALQHQTGPNAGSWDADDRWGRVGGRVYSTAMAALALKYI